MIQLHLLSGRTAPATLAAPHLPATLGRDAGCDLCLEEDGVWDRHLEFSATVSHQIRLQSATGAFTAVNGQPLQDALLCSGDLIEIGGVRLRFGLAPVRQRSLVWREASTWIALGALAAGQIALIYALTASS